MLNVTLQPRWQIGAEGQPPLDASELLGLLAAVDEAGGIAQGARLLGWSYRHAWGRIRQAEAVFGQALIETGRGRGSTLTALGRKLVWADARISARLSPLLATLASELASELDRRTARGAVRLHASHGFAVATLMEQLQLARLPVELRYRNSFEAVAALAGGECDLAGFHVPIGEFAGAAAQRYLAWLRPGRHRLIHLAVRTQGLFLAAGNPLGVSALADLARPGVRFVNRPEGSGTRMLTDLLFVRHGLEPAAVAGYADTELTHAAVAAYVASGMADAGIGVQTAAQRFGLHFMPLLRERYFLAVSVTALQRPELQAVLRVLRSQALRARVAALAGYEAAHTGEVLELSGMSD